MCTVGARQDPAVPVFWVCATAAFVTYVYVAAHYPDLDDRQAALSVAGTWLFIWWFWRGLRYERPLPAPPPLPKPPPPRPTPAPPPAPPPSRPRRGDPDLRDKVFRALFFRDNGHCGICGKPIAMPLNLASVHIDHFKPVALGGSDDLDNLQLAHRRFNLRKGARNWRPRVSRPSPRPPAANERKPPSAQSPTEGPY